MRIQNNRENKGSVEGQSKGQSWVSRGSHVDQMLHVRETTCACTHSLGSLPSVDEEAAVTYRRTCLRI